MNFQEVIKQYLDGRASQDEQFAVTYAKENKSIEECCKYIIGEARKLGTEVCMSDDEVFGLAVHYYDEDNIKVEEPKVDCKVKTAEDVKKYYPEATKAVKKPKKAEFVQMSLF